MMPDIPKRTKEYPQPAPVEKEEEEATWVQSWGGSAYYLHGVRPFTATVYYDNHPDEKGNQWMVTVNDVRMKWNSPNREHAENRAEVLLIKWMERAIATLRRKHEKENTSE